MIQMLVLNKVSRYDVVKVAIEEGGKIGKPDSATIDKLKQDIEKQVEDFWKYAHQNGKGLWCLFTNYCGYMLTSPLDPDGIFDKPQF